MEKKIVLSNEREALSATMVMMKKMIDGLPKIPCVICSFPPSSRLVILEDKSLVRTWFAGVCNSCLEEIKDEDSCSYN